MPVFLTRGTFRTSRVGLSVALRVTVAMMVVAVTGALGVAPAMATVGWTVHSIANPTNFAPNGAPECNGHEKCNSYDLVVENVGDTDASGRITVTDELPVGITTGQTPKTPGFAIFQRETETTIEDEQWSCGSMGAGQATVTCELQDEKTDLATGEVELVPASVPAGHYAPFIEIPVSAPTAISGTLVNSATVLGGGAASPGATSEETTISAEPPRFGVTDSSVDVLGTDGTQETQAGGHPGAVSVSFGFPDIFAPPGQGDQVTPVRPVENVKDVAVDLPLGFLGNPQATARCPEDKLVAEGASERRKACPAASQVGVATYSGDGTVHETGEYGASPIFSVVPEAGYPAEFGFALAGTPVFAYASLVRTSAGYRVRVAAPGIVSAIGIDEVELTFFGDAAARDERSSTPTAFLTNPVDCGAGPLSAMIEADSWENPGVYTSQTTTAYPQVTGCNLFSFDPSITSAPAPAAEGGTTQADEPTGYSVDVKEPQTSLFEENATPELKDASVSLPEGVSVSPSAASGLVGCAATGAEGIDIPNDEGRHPDEAGEGEAIDAYGLTRSTAGHCPAASTLGTVEVFTPLLPTRCGSEGQAACSAGESPAPLQGHIYLAQPKCGGAGQAACTEASATNGELFGVYIEVEGSGVIVKLPGTIAANPADRPAHGNVQGKPAVSLQRTQAAFQGGPRAPLANPQTCGCFATHLDAHLVGRPGSLRRAIVRSSGRPPAAPPATCRSRRPSPPARPARPRARSARSR